MARITKEELLEKLFHDDYEHLKDFLCQYLSIIDESYARLFDIYNELENQKSEMTLTNQGQSLNMTGSKKVVS